MQVGITDLLNPYIGKIKVLSLDCFDTVLWRTVAKPHDVFFDLIQKPQAKSFNLTVKKRTEAEHQARLEKFMLTGSHEVTLQEIYEKGFPELSSDAIQSLMNEELEAEIDCCYGFPPALQLMRDAKQRGLKMIIVSNTYLKENQLRHLLSQVLPKDVYDSIETVYCSSEYHAGKQNGLFEKIMQKQFLTPETILHIGDSPHIDLEPAKKLGMHALHLVHLDHKIAELMRMQSAACLMADPFVRYKYPLPSPYHGVFAASGLESHRPEYVIGFTSVGPIIYGFARYVLEEMEKLKQANHKPKLMFIMRDGFLVSHACEALVGESIGPRVHISRFTSCAVSFKTKEDIIDYLIKNMNHWKLGHHCLQFMLTEEMSQSILDITNQDKDPKKRFCELILEDKTVQYILEQATQYRKRFKRYLEKVVDIKPGDTVMFVDVGYRGSAQELITPFLKSEMQVKDVVGRYLLAIDGLEWKPSHGGCIDPSWCDNRTMAMLGLNFTLVEEMLSSGGNSVIDYKEDGNPIYAESKESQEQHQKIKLIQTESLKFVRMAKQFFNDANKSVSMDMLRVTTLAELARCIYLLTATEIEYMAGFKHEVNKATHVAHDIFNPQETSELRRKGLSFINQRAHSIRSSGDLQHSITLMAQRRFDFELLESDVSLRREKIAAKITQEDKTTEAALLAKPTHDGYYSLTIAIQRGVKKLKVEIKFGQLYKWIQFECADIIAADKFSTRIEEGQYKDYWSNLSFKKMVNRGNKLFECSSKEGAMVVKIPEMVEASTILITFRPVVKLSAIESKNAVNEIPA